MARVKFIRLEKGKGLKYPVWDPEKGIGVPIQAAENVLIPPGEYRLVPTGFCLENIGRTHDWALFITPIRTMSTWRGFPLASTMDFIHPSYTDEIRVPLRNATKIARKVKRTERVARLVAIPLLLMDIVGEEK